MSTEKRMIEVTPTDKTADELYAQIAEDSSVGFVHGDRIRRAARGLVALVKPGYTLAQVEAAIRRADERVKAIDPVPLILAELTGANSPEKPDSSADDLHSRVEALVQEWQEADSLANRPQEFDFAKCVFYFDPKRRGVACHACFHPGHGFPARANWDMPSQRWVDAAKQTSGVVAQRESVGLAKGEESRHSLQSEGSGLNSLPPPQSSDAWRTNPACPPGMELVTEAYRSILGHFWVWKKIDKDKPVEVGNGEWVLAKDVEDSHFSGVFTDAAHVWKCARPVKQTSCGGAGAVTVETAGEKSATPVPANAQPPQEPTMDKVLSDLHAAGGHTYDGKRVEAELPIDPGEGYYLLPVGTQKCEGDEFESEGDGRTDWLRCCVFDLVTKFDNVRRRKPTPEPVKDEQSYNDSAESRVNRLVIRCFDDGCKTADRNVRAADALSPDAHRLIEGLKVHIVRLERLSALAVDLAKAVNLGHKSPIHGQVIDAREQADSIIKKIEQEQQ